MNNISKYSNCYGCGVCASVCPKKVISLSLNDEGFYVPTIDESGCTKCGLCLSVCAYAHENVAETDNFDVKAYAAWSKDPEVRKKCSSGGVGFELGRHLLKGGYKVCGVRYNPGKNRAEHYIASTPEELIQSVGSKYIQSYTPDGFRQVNRREKYLITGTPCQIDSFRRYIKVEDNFILMDFFCHGVPSMLMWNKYLKKVENITGKVNYVSWRNKFTGWHDSWSMAIDGDCRGKKVDWHQSYNMLIRGEKTYYNSRLSQGDMFYQMFLSNTCLGKSCYEKCKYKYVSSAADIRIGDLWGKEYEKNESGVSGVLTLTQKGDDLLKAIDMLSLKEHSIDTVTAGQMKKKVSYPTLYPVVQKMLRSDCPIDDFRYILLMHKIIWHFKSLIRKLKR